MAKTKIDWTDMVWNPTVGCKKVSSGCTRCYAERMACRLAAMGQPEYQAVTKDGRWTGHVKCLPERLYQPLKWKKPRKIFVNSMSDLFHVDVPFEFIAQVWFIMITNPRHTFIVLTKRPERMYEFCGEFLPKHWGEPALHPALPAINVWLGASAENQAAADERIPLLLQTPAAVRFVSVEPMLESVSLAGLKDNIYRPWLDTHAWKSGLNWVICGGESGPNRRPFDIDWARSLRDQCVKANVPFFLKQMPVDGKLVKMPFLDGRQWEEYPTCASG